MGPRRAGGAVTSGAGDRGRGVRAVARLALALLLIACAEESTVPKNPSIAGSWSGDAVAGQVRFSATFTQDGEAVGGTGEFTSPLGSGPFTVVGTLVGANVELTLTSAEFGTTTYSGRFTSADRIEGNLDAPNFSDIELALERE